MLYLRKIFLQLLFSLVLLIASCQFNEEVEDITEQAYPKEITYIQKDGIYIIGENWNKEKLDSLIHLKNEYYFIENNKDLVFITSQNDSLSMEISSIKRTNPIIVFNKKDGPILTSLERISYYLFPKPHKEKEEKLFLEKPNTEPDFQETDKKSDIVAERKTVFIDRIHPKIGHQLIHKPSRNLPYIASNEISQNYPIIPNSKNLIIHFDNDFWDYTDYYYTNGIKLSHVHPIFSNSLISRLLVSNSTNGLDYYGIQLDQKMYTGLYPKLDSIIPGDRPWAAYMTIGQTLESYDHSKKIKHESEVNIGILGPKSGGGFLQDLVHTILPNNSPPEGWDNQIKTDIIIDYQYTISKLLYEAKQFESYIKAKAQIGTLRDNINWGGGAKYGIFTPFYIDSQNILNNEMNRKVYLSVFGDIETQLIAYDATLQGGVTDRTSIYVIPTKAMERFILKGYIGMELTYKKVQLQFIQFWKSKEFKTGKDHKYVSVRLYIGF